MHADVVELVDTLALGASALGREGSSPFIRTKIKARLLVGFLSWCLSTTKRELSSSEAVSEPRRLCGHARTRPTRKTLCIFFEVSPAEIFWIWKRHFWWCAQRLCRCLRLKRILDVYDIAFCHLLACKCIPRLVDVLNFYNFNFR